MIHGVAPHPDAMSNKYVLGAAVGGVASEFAERSLRFLYVRQNFTLDDNFCADWDLEILHAALGEHIGLAKETANYLILPDLRWVGVDHRTHIVERVNTERDGDGKTLPALFGAAVELPHAPPGVQRYPQPVFALEHKTMEARGVDAGNGVASRQLSSGDIGRGVDRKMERNGQRR